MTYPPSNDRLAVQSLACRVSSQNRLSWAADRSEHRGGRSRFPDGTSKGDVFLTRIKSERLSCVSFFRPKATQAREPLGVALYEKPRRIAGVANRVIGRLQAALPPKKQAFWLPCACQL